MRKIAAAIAVFMLGGCAHADSRRIANTVIAAAFIAVEVSAAESSAESGGRAPFCSDDDGNPPHTCPGTTPAPASPPPPPPE